jgi:hypothetical protein
MDREQDLAFEILNEEAVRELVVNICWVLTEHGITEIHVGGLMRLVGIDCETASDYDGDVMVITDIQQKIKEEEGDTSELIETRPADSTLH